MIRRAPALLFVALTSSPAAADEAVEEPRAPNEPVIPREPTETMLVADAFDDGDAFDFDTTLAFSFEARFAELARESGSSRVAIASYRENVSRLTPGIEFGVYRDVAIFARLPIVLSKTVALSPIGDGGPVTAPGGADTLFSLPYRSPDRSGVELLEIGAQASILHQGRKRGPLTWNVGFTIGIPVGEAMYACRDVPPEGQVACAHPADVDRDGKRSGDEPAGIEELTPGISRGLLGLSASTEASWRHRFVEPFLGLTVTGQIPALENVYSLVGVDTDPPPILLGGYAGISFIPWENRERHNRFVLENRFSFDYTSGGRDYSELFDVIGSSAAPSLRETSPGGAHVTGLTEVEAHTRFTVSATATWQPSRYIKLAADASFLAATERLVTADTEEEPTFVEGLDREGARFAISHDLTIRVGAHGTVMF